jgi:glycosyltransferase involved in cell wall biosynthesis
MVTGTYLPQINGAVLQCAGLIERLSERVSFQVLTGGDGPDQTDPASGNRKVIKIHRIIRTTSLALKVRSALGILGLLARERFDVIHLHGFSSKALLVGPMAKLFGSKIVLKCTSLGVDDALSLDSRGWVFRRFLASVDTLICPSPAFIEAGLRAGLRTDRLVSIPNFVDAHRFRPGTSEERSASRAELKLKPTDFAILFVGHFSRDKRPDFLFDALIATLVGNPNIQLIMVGEAIANHFEVDRALLAVIQAKASALGIQDQIRWIRQHQRMENLYMAVDLFALPSIREGMPNALAEAMCAQLPVVATNLQGVTDWMLEGGKCGQLVPNESDPSSLTISIVELLENAEKRRSLAAHARRRCIEGFSPHEVCEQVWRVYQTLNGNFLRRMRIRSETWLV